MKTLYLNTSEVNFLVNYVGNLYTWPPESSSWASAIIPVDEQDGSIGPFFRIKLLAMERKLREQLANNVDTTKRDDNGKYYFLLPLDCTPAELWMLDGLMAQLELRTDIRPEQVVKLPDGEPIRNLAVKIWDALVFTHADILSDELKPKEMPLGSTIHRPSRAEGSDDAAWDRSAADFADAIADAFRPGGADA